MWQFKVTQLHLGRRHVDRNFFYHMTGIDRTFTCIDRAVHLTDMMCLKHACRNMICLHVLWINDL